MLIIYLSHLRFGMCQDLHRVASTTGGFRSLGDPPLPPPPPPELTNVPARLPLDALIRASQPGSWIWMPYSCCVDVSISCPVLSALFRKISLQFVPQVPRVVTFALRIFQKLHNPYVSFGNRSRCESHYSCLLTGQCGCSTNSIRPAQ